VCAPILEVEIDDIDTELALGGWIERKLQANGKGQHVQNSTYVAPHNQQHVL
jgi:hypothetical protein